MKHFNLLLLALLFVQCKTLNNNFMKDDSKIKSNRNFFETLGKIYEPANAVKIQNANIANVDCYWFTPKNYDKDKIIIYLHGGSYYMGSVNSHSAMLSHFSEKLNARILFLEYPLAPENVYPSAINKIVKVYENVLNSFSADNVIIMGDSAGGGLLVSFLGKINSKNYPSKVVMISPWLNLESNSNSYTKNASKDKILKKEDLLYASNLYANDLGKANPAEINFKIFPETLILVGSDEIILDDSLLFKKQNNSVKIIEYANVGHVWPLTNIYSNESVKLINDIKNFIE